MLWQSLKSFLSLVQQQEFHLINDKYKIAKMKPLAPKDKKSQAVDKKKHPSE